MGSELNRRINAARSTTEVFQLAHAPPNPVLEAIGRAEEREQRENMNRQKPERPSPYTPGAAKK
jgi:hypothetical protein